MAKYQAPPLPEGEPLITSATRSATSEAISCSIAGRSLWRRRSLVRSPDDRSRGGDLLFDRQTIALGEAICCSIAGRSRSGRRSVVRSPDVRSRGRGEKKNGRF